MFNGWNAGGDLSVQLQKFLASGAIDPHGKLSGILKCIQQEIICPPVMDLRMDIYPSFPYKDVKVGTHSFMTFVHYQYSRIHRGLGMSGSNCISLKKRTKRKMMFLRSLVVLTAMKRAQ